MNPLSNAEVVSGVANNPSDSERPHRVVSKRFEVQVVDAAMSSTSCLDELLYTYRSKKKTIKLINKLGPPRAAFYSKAANCIENGATVLRDVARCMYVQHLSLMDGARCVAADFAIIIDRKKQKRRHYYLILMRASF